MRAALFKRQAVQCECEWYLTCKFAALIMVNRAELQLEFERMNGLPLAGGSRMWRVQPTAPCRTGRG